jgi:P pilus assembly chaperone PapD
MKISKSFLVLFLLFLGINSYAQVVVTPYVVMIDKNNKFGTYTVINETNQEQMVSIGFKFGFPVSDENGNITMKYVDAPSADMPDLTSKIKVFPKKFTLAPKQRQIIRMTVNPKANLKEGTYFTRIITSSQTKQPVSDSTTNFSAKINFVLNQITTVIYSNGKYSSKIDFRDAKVNVTESNVDLISMVSAKGDSPFYASFVYKIYDSSGKIVKEANEYLGIYFDMAKKYSIPVKDIGHGSFTAEIQISSDETPDIPRIESGAVSPVIKKVSFNIP